MAAVFGPDRPADRPCLIGSVKPNIGHLEAGAGVAGVIKTVLAMRHGTDPAEPATSTIRTRRSTGPGPACGWSPSSTPWPVTAASPSRAGVSGYGYGGTIAHVILERAAAVTEPGGQDRGPALYPISGASPQAVRDYAVGLAEHLAKHR